MGRGGAPPLVSGRCRQSWLEQRTSSWGSGRRHRRRAEKAWTEKINRRRVLGFWNRSMVAETGEVGLSRGSARAVMDGTTMARTVIAAAPG
ncbi:hypothetical protein M0R45_035782 [Rubus argutus]|uniref:Uncharacterized protein n=1 Tax=Rubus argutus TaxID=59490 RepID=A0AAW1VYQ3_RUBAR